MNNEHESDIDVVEQARRRVANVFGTAGRIVMNVSGGKDSVCLNDIVYKTITSGRADPSKLEVVFIDEEAIYPCVERIVRGIRTQWLSLGVPFSWYCVQVRHYNCLNSLVNEESFVCWDAEKRDRWIRPMPKFAISSDPFLRERKDTYQSFLDRKYAHHVTLAGVRMQESIQRRAYMSGMGDQGKMFPIYDWKDTDVWQYIRDNGLEIPDAYLYMYQCGVPRNRMRISQFFSVDTVGNLVEMCKFYPHLFDRICAREPNAYLSMLYYDTEMFRRSKRKAKVQERGFTSYESEVKRLLSERWRYKDSASMRNAYKDCTKLMLKYGPYLNESSYKYLFDMLQGGDPKHRLARALEIGLKIQIATMEE